MPARPRAPPRVALLSFQSHSDRSFLDDRELALVSGDLTALGIANDLVLTVLGGGADAEVERRLAAMLGDYDTIVFERVWSRDVIARLRLALPDRTFISLRGEHALDDPPADWICGGDFRQTLPPLLAHLRGSGPVPLGSSRREGDRFIAPSGASVVPERPLAFAPNLHPQVVNPEALPPTRSFSILGNAGCPYQADARANPLYAGVQLPAGLGRGCAFCTTGNRYQGDSNEATAASVLEQIRTLRAGAPERTLFVLKDQNPFGYLTEVVESCEREGLGGFTVLLETRADWLLRSEKRFERALQAAGRSRMRIAPFLVGVENFSQAELDRFNKGTTAQATVEFLERLWAWKEAHQDALDLSHAAFGFVLFTPWTTLADLEHNLAAVRRTRFDRLRGSLLLSRVRLYPDTALYYLAERDSLLTGGWEDEGSDSARRYGYYPGHPWRFAQPEVARFARLAAELSERTKNRDEVALFAFLLESLRSAADPATLDAEDLYRRFAAAREEQDDNAGELRQRFGKLVTPLPIDGEFAPGWRFGKMRQAPGRLRVRLEPATGDGVELELCARRPGEDAPRFTRSRHYDLSTLGGELTDDQRAAVTRVIAAIVRNDR